MKQRIGSAGRRGFVALGAALIGLGTAATGHALESDSQIGVTLIGMAEVDGVGIQVDAHARITENVSRLSQQSGRLTLSVPVNRAVSLGGGYFFGYSELIDDPDIVEHRAFEQVVIRMGGLPSGYGLSARSRIEQRFRQDRGGGMGLRGFQQARLQVPFGKRVSGIFVVEAAYNLNTTQWGQRAGFGNLRGAFNLSVPITRHVSFQPGYSGQYIKRWRAEGRFIHAALVTLAVRI